MIKTKLKNSLKKYFGFDTFRPGQKEIVEDTISNFGTIGMLPTGTGKSLCYQLSGYLLDGQVIIVSPLISLMQDQVDQMRLNGEKRVISLNSTQDVQTQNKILNHLDQYKFIFISPESLQRKPVKAILSRLKIGLFVIDEAHCISQWGPDFRPDFLNLGNIADQLHAQHVLALTATASNRVLNDIKRIIFKNQQVKIVSTSVNRPNIFMALKAVKSDSEKQADLVALIQRSKTPAIIYFSSKQKLAEISQLLAEKTHNRVAQYHADLSDSDRFRIQQQFMAHEIDVVCATNAFGMGINLADIRLIVHYHMPTNMMAYTQEIGRAGRDGNQSLAIGFVMPNDFSRMQRLSEIGVLTKNEIHDFFSTNIKNQTNSEEVQLLRRYEKLGMSEQQIQSIVEKRVAEKNFLIQQMQDFVTTEGCLRNALLGIFDEPQTIKHDELCCQSVDLELSLDQLLKKLKLFKQSDEPKNKMHSLNWKNTFNTLFLEET